MSSGPALAAPKAAVPDAWNPGLVPGIPRAFLPLATVFRPENVETTLSETFELSDACGLPATQLALFRPERLVVHEVLIRVMADLSVPVGEVYADLGLNFRRMVATILSEGIAAQMPALLKLLAAIRDEAAALLERELAELLDAPAEPEAAEAPEPEALPWYRRLGKRRPPVEPSPPPARREPGDLLRRLEARRAEAAPGSLEEAARDALHRVLSSVLARHGCLIHDRALLCRIAGILVSNDHGSRRIGLALEPAFDAAASRAGYRRLAAQKHPVVMTVKGASASGKSTIRPYQRDLVERGGQSWCDFAVITPDVWRKYLLDYMSLGAARLYAGPLTGHEVEIVDAKLDRHVARKAAEGRISHLLIDRFRFDSFSADPAAEGGGQLLSRFGQQVYLQFMVTPPEATVERAWKRGQEFGRYKAVEDLLAHNVEAYTGMPRLFFNWALRRDKAVFFEFLDNGVPKGTRPRTIAFGTNNAMVILDAAGLIDIERFRKIDIHARCPGDVYGNVDSAPERNAGFLRDCLRRLPRVCFAEAATGQVFARYERGRLAGIDRETLARVCTDPATCAALAAAGLPAAAERAAPIREALPRPDPATLGAWSLRV
ncbi:zeta toxin family protein [Methylobacterium organophilum]|uniref:UDP-N-acetylglucosamine kinase n=1 Tax=Methylobacterium organophilum TaxID=410 RepID=A0ABQ4T7F4_METOR|nr:zeta toxin family protein [Methylobacterium organophilum]GJE26379.1 hypothetical protein LKMONMHP_1230 [Methylobacterium organophilum]